MVPVKNPDKFHLLLSPLEDETVNCSSSYASIQIVPFLSKSAPLSSKPIYFQFSSKNIGENHITGLIEVRVNSIRFFSHPFPEQTHHYRGPSINQAPFAFGEAIFMFFICLEVDARTTCSMTTRPGVRLTDWCLSADICSMTAFFGLASNFHRYTLDLCWAVFQWQWVFSI